MNKALLLLGSMSLLLSGCMQPMADTATHDPDSSYVSTNGPASGTPADHATVDPSRNELNHMGATDQNGGSSAPAGSTGNSGSR